MPQRRAHLAPESTHGQLAAALTALREEFEVPDGFPADVLAEAEAVSAQGPGHPALDLRDVPFVTLDPDGSRDLDQAFHLETFGSGGYLLRYAIADVPGFVRPGGALDREARLRGQTLYLPDGIVPLHPPVLSEDRASLLAGVDRTAFVWTIHVDAAGAAAFEGAEVPPARVERALIRSRAQLSYESAQVAIDAMDGIPGIATGITGPPGTWRDDAGRDGTGQDGTGDDGQHLGQLTRLRAFGLLRIARERARGGASLNMPDEEVVHDAHGYRIERRFPLPIEDWNAQLSLLTGMVAGHMMLEAGIGILRTMPAPDAQALSEFRTRVAALGAPWPAEVPYGVFLELVPRDTALGIAVLHAASSLFRGAGYSVFGAPDATGGVLALDGSPVQAAIAAPYAHVTAPLRRLVDRWGLVICEAHSSSSPVPEWVIESLHELPSLMRASSSVAGRVGSEALDRVEAALMRDLLGTELPATVLEASETRARVQLSEPPVTAQARVAEGDLAPSPGAHVRVLVHRADVASGTIELDLVPPATGSPRSAKLSSAKTTR